MGTAKPARRCGDEASAAAAANADRCCPTRIACVARVWMTAAKGAPRFPREKTKNQKAAGAAARLGWVACLVVHCVAWGRCVKQQLNDRGVACAGRRVAQRAPVLVAALDHAAELLGGQGLLRRAHIRGSGRGAESR